MKILLTLMLLSPFLLDINIDTLHNGVGETSEAYVHWGIKYKM